MLESIIIYVLLYLIMVICCINERNAASKYIEGSGIFQKNKHFFSGNMIVLSLSFAFVFGCRWGVGRDYFRYLDSYLYETPGRFEYIFYTITNSLKTIDAHYSIYFGILALIDIALLYYAARDYRFIFPYIAFFLIFGYHFLAMMNAIRQSIAALIFMVSIKYIDEKNIGRYALCVVAAVLFHKLSILLFVFYPLLRMRNDWFQSIQFQLILYVVAIILSFNYDFMLKWVERPFEFLVNILDYDNYQYDTLFEDRFDRTNLGRNTGLGIWANMLRTIPIIVLSGEMKRYYNSNRFNMIYTLYFLGVLLTLMFGRSIILNRFSLFLQFFTIYIYGFFVYFCFEKRNAWYQILAIMLVFIHIPLFLNIVSNPRAMAQYSFFWENKMFF